jgi:hypothetical protein
MYRKIDELLATAPNVQVSPVVRHRQLATAHLISALDAVEESRRGDALRHLRAAVRAHPPSAADTRFVAALAALGLGRRGRDALGRLRFLVLRKRLRVHVRR